MSLPAVSYDARTALYRLHRLRDVRTALLDPVTFAVDNALEAITPIAEPGLRTLAAAGVTLPPALANNGTPTHAPLRQVVNSYVDGARVRAAVPMIERLAGEHVALTRERLAADGEADLVDTIARDLPARVLLELLEIPPADRPEPAELSAWGEAAFELFWGWPDEARQVALAEQVGACHTWLLARLRSARRDGGTGFLAGLARARDDEGRLLPLRLVASAGFFTVLAGQQTTGYLLARLFQRVLARPGLAAEIARHPQLGRETVEQTLREQSPVPSWRRVTRCPVTVDGTPLPAGAAVLLMLEDAGAAAPDQPHVAFGAGAHRCPGAALARAEATTVLRVAAPLLAEVRPTGADPAELRLLSFSAPRHVGVRPT